MGYDNTITNGVCVGCKKHFKNNSRRINIARCLDDNELYCKSCAIKKDTDGFFKSLPKPNAPQQPQPDNIWILNPTRVRGE